MTENLTIFRDSSAALPLILRHLHRPTYVLPPKRGTLGGKPIPPHSAFRSFAGLSAFGGTYLGLMAYIFVCCVSNQLEPLGFVLCVLRLLPLCARPAWSLRSFQKESGAWASSRRTRRWWMCDGLVDQRDLENSVRVCFSTKGARV